MQSHLADRPSALFHPIKFEITSQIEDRVFTYKRIMMHPEKAKQERNSPLLWIKDLLHLLMSGGRCSQIYLHQSGLLVNLGAPSTYRILPQLSCKIATAKGATLLTQQLPRSIMETRASRGKPILVKK